MTTNTTTKEIEYYTNRVINQKANIEELELSLANMKAELAESYVILEDLGVEL